MSFNVKDLEAAFRKTGISGLQITKRPNGGKWVVVATFEGAWLHDRKTGVKKKLVIAPEPSRSLEALLIETLKMAPSNPKPDAAEPLDPDDLI